MKGLNFDYVVDIAKAYEDEGNWIVEGFAATSDFDLQEDIISQEAIEGSAKDLIENSTVLHNHNTNEEIGRVMESGAREGGLFLKILVSKTVPDIWQKIKEGVLNKFSVRGMILEAKKQWMPALQKYARLILKMRLVEVSLVAVPANPKARAIRWYIEKALDQFEESGGRIEEANGEAGIPGPRKGGNAMGDEVREEEEMVLLEASGGGGEGGGDRGFPPPEKLEEEWTAHCKERGVEKNAATRDLWEGFCKENGYPHPYPYPYPGTGGGTRMRQIVDMVDKLLADEKDEDRKKVLSQIRTLAAGATNASPPAGTQKEETARKEGDAGAAADQGADASSGRTAALLDLGIAKADAAISKPRLRKLKKLVEELQKIILEVEPVDGGEARKDAAPDASDPSGKALAGIAEAVKRIEGTLAPKPDAKTGDQKPIEKQVEDLTKRLSTLEGKAGTRASLEGQEALPGDRRGDKSLWKGVV